MFYEKKGRGFARNTWDVIRMSGGSENENEVKSVKISMPSIVGNNNVQQDKEEFTILCFNLSAYSPTARFVICCVGVFVFYLIYGFFQELIFQLEGFKPYGMYLTLVQFIFYSLFGYVEKTYKKDNIRKIPLKSYVLIAVLTVGTMGFSNTSLGYLNYPTQVIFKCCKLIPVLVMGIFIQGKVYTLIDVVACLCMSIGLIFFTLADSQISPTFSVFGVFLISMALCSDAVIGNVQEKVMKQYGGSNTEMVFYSYGIGFFILLAFEIVTGQLFSAFTFCMQYPVNTYGYAFIFSLTGYLGVNFVLTLIKSSGALIAVTVTTCRKALTIVLSFMLFSKPFTSQYVWSGLIVMLGIYLNIYSKNRSKIDQKIKYFYKTFTERRHQHTLAILETV